VTLSLEEATSSQFRSFLDRRSFLGGLLLGSAGSLFPRSLLAELGSVDKEAGTLSIAAAKTARTLDPDAINSYLQWEDIEAVVNLYERLVVSVTAPNAMGVHEAVFGEYVGGLAASWEVSADGRTWTFKLREGVKSFRGNEMTAEDVKWGWDRSYAIKDLGHWIGQRMMLVRSNEDVRVIGRNSIQITTEKSNPNFLLSVWPLPAVFDTKEVKRHLTPDDPWGRRWLAENDAGFGAYHVESFDPGREVIFVANNNYYRGRPVLQRVEYHGVADPSDRMVRVLAGEVDIAEWLTPKQRAIISRIGQASGVKLLSARSTNYLQLGLNLELKPFDDVRVRRAIAFAVPYDEIIEKAYYGTARRMRAFTSDIYPGYDPELRLYETDPQKAQELLAQAGYGDGFRVTLYYSTRYPEEVEDTAYLIKEALAPLGIEVLPRKVTPKGMQELKHLTKDFHMYLFRNGSLLPGPREQMHIYFGDASRYGAGEDEDFTVSERKKPTNYIGGSDPELTQLVVRSEDLPKLADRWKVYEKVQTRALERAYLIPVALVGQHLAVRAGISGWTLHTHQQIRFADIVKEGSELHRGRE